MPPGPNRSQRPGGHRALSVPSLQISFPGIQQGRWRGGIWRAHRGLQYIWYSRPNQIFPACPSDLVFCPLPLTYRISTTLTFFFQFFKYMQLAPASGPLPLLFPLPGRLSSSSSPHSTEDLGQMSPPGTIQSPIQLCPHPLPSHSFFCIALPVLHHSLFH